MKIANSIKMFQISFILASMIPFTAYAAPTINSVSGTVTHNQPIIVTGTGFGVKSPVAPAFWDTVSYTGLSNGSVIPVGGSNVWPATCSDVSVYYKTSNPRGKWAAHYSNQWSTDGAKKGAMDGKTISGAKTSGKIYITWWNYLSSDPSVGGTNASNKWIRTLSASWGASGEGTVIWEPTQLYSYGFTSGYLPSNHWPDMGVTYPAWNRMELYINSTTANSPDYQAWVNNSSVGHFSSSPTQSWKADTLGCLGFDGSNTSASSQPTVDFGEIYADNTPARVEICNASTKSSSNHCEIQIPQNTWVDGQLEVKVNQGSFADGATAFLFVVDANNSVSPGYAIKIGGTPSPVSGACGTASGASFSSLTSSSSNLCSAGAVFGFSGTGPWSWGCQGANGGADTASNACSAAYIAPTSVNGSCGSSNGGTFSSTPTTGLCSSGTGSSVALSGSNYTWTCAGSYGGTTTSCSANYSAPASAPVPAPAPSSFNIGETAILSTADAAGANALQAFSVSLSSAATIQSMSVYVGIASGNLRLGIYDATGTGGGPGTLKASTAEFTPTTGWNTVNITTPVSLTAGTYWLGLLPSSSSLELRSAPSGNMRSSSYTYGVLPPKFPSFASYTWHWSLYATLSSAQAVNGVCGTSDGQSLATAPTTNLCTTGTASVISGTGPWAWSCAGINGGATASCSASYSTTSSYVQRNECTSPPAGTIFCEDFEGANPKANFNDYDGNPDTENLVVTDSGPAIDATNKTIRFRVPAGQAGGSDLLKVLSTGYDKLYARWYFKYEPGFNFSARNHGSGLTAGDRGFVGQSGNRPNGNDFAAFLDQYHENTAIPYSYSYYRGMYQDCGNPIGGCYGDSLPCVYDNGSSYCTKPQDRPTVTMPALVAGKWYCYEQMVDMGAASTDGFGATGRLSQWLDGSLFGDNTNLWLRTTTGLKLQNLWLSLYHHDGTHSTVGEMIDNVVVSTKRIGCGPSAISAPEGFSIIRIIK